MDKYTLFWSQNVNPNTPNTIGIDGEIYFYKPDPELDEAVLFLMDSCWDKLFKKTVSFSKICNDYDVPDNFILIWDKEKGLLIQSVFQNRDESGRPLTFRLWCRRVSISVACESLQKYAELSGKKLRDNEVNNIINITNKINEKIKEVKEEKRRKKK